MTRPTITRVLDETGLQLWQEAREVAFAHDFEHLPADPIEERREDVLGTGPEAGERLELWLAQDGGIPVAAAHLSLPTRDNTETAGISLQVHPGHRGRGFGRALLTSLLTELAAAGRPRVFFEVPSPYPEGPAPMQPLLASLGARPVLREVRRAVDLHAHPVTDPVAAPSGYRLHQWEGAASGELVDDLAYLKHRLSTDAPLGEMDWEPEQWDAGRYREEEAAVRLRGRQRLTTAVEDLTTGRLVGLTEIAVSIRAPEVGYQWATLVVPEQRGRSLGLVLKQHHHRFVAEHCPETRWVNTWNAESNTFMVRVNDLLGYAPREYWTEWQLDR